ncbi:hypothetical protein CKAN_00920200 [Cinnamomum micranthum f. kanehirae]|uniref:Uncharacterized protein n=1 Tax=Cinnamomum micranthum f. kanehirae TaxID=337451 RepID=A0A3S3Q896_9MAGN|nr:hypothetical protein CKAN_00920200 [Cinnamomum micranthum f. kanehirae]
MSRMSHPIGRFQQLQFKGCASLLRYEHDELLASNMGTNLSLNSSSCTTQHLCSSCIQLSHLTCSQEDFCLAYLSRSIMYYKA